MSRSALEEIDKVSGAFVRKPSMYRDIISSQPGARFSPEPNRYHLYVSLACPWANRCVAGLHLKGLNNVIGLSVTHPTWQRTRPDLEDDHHCGWVFAHPTDPPLTSPAGYGSFSCNGCIPDPIHPNAKSIRDLYDIADHTSGENTLKYTVPVLWDKKTHTVVNNESSEILRMLNSEFNAFAESPSLDLYPVEHRAIIDELNEWIYDKINNGVYKCGFATSQEAYDIAFKELFEALDRLEELLKKSRYLCGDVLTEADVRLFMTLIRFDPVYVVYFKTDRKAIREYVVLSEYVKDMYQTPGIKESINMEHIKTHYFTSHPKLNAYAIIPGGPSHWWEEPHNRYGMTKQSIAFEV